jgi:hypothetical protein
MHEKLEKHLDEALSEFSDGDHYETLVKAKEEYFSRTGQTLEEDDDYESRMRTFNDWYLLQFTSQHIDGRVIDRYLDSNEVETEISESFKSFNHSLFEYTGENLKKRFVLKDILHNKKIILSEEHSTLPLLKSDLFLGRVLEYDEKHYLMSGLCTLPRDAKSILNKECKKIRKLEEPDNELEFLLQVESLRTRWLRYGHVNTKEIFDFRKTSK